jgi:hypothetical protein
MEDGAATLRDQGVLVKCRMKEQVNRRTHTPTRTALATCKSFQKLDVHVLLPEAPELKCSHA